MDGLTANSETLTANGELLNKKFKSLTQNFRSSEEVVKFNLSLFDRIIRKDGAPDRIYGEEYDKNKLAQFYQADKKPGGYVQFKAFPKGTKEEMALYMFDRIGELVEKGTRLSDILILVREKKEANLICGLSPYPVVSADSYVLEASADVQLIIAGLRVLVKNDLVAALYIEMRTGSIGFIEQIRSSITPDTPLFETVSELIRILLCDTNGRYHGSETAYLNNLLDRTRAYVSAYGSSLADFLTYWEDTMHAKAIPAASSDAIRIMTVHASKGLQAQTLFVPFCMWPKEAGRHPQKVWCPVAPEIHMGDDCVPIQDGPEMGDSAYAQVHEEEHANMRIDNLNMLYVALTRAEDNLFVYTSYPVTVNGVMGTCNHVGRYIMDFAGADDYEAGTPVIKAKSQELIANSQTAELWSDGKQVQFVQSQEGALYTDYGDEAYRRMARMDEGTLCHEIFAHVRKAEELDAVLDMFESSGEIKDKEQRQTLKNLISSAWKGNEQMKDWFTAPWELRLEEAIYIDRQELRPDRVMINPVTHEAIVLDYKFGAHNKKYYAQVNEYKEALRRIGYNPVRGYLWFAKENKLEEVK